ncbi:TPA: hypothetical protein ACGXMV_004127 [Bacillus pacificus]
MVRKLRYRQAIAYTVKEKRKKEYAKLERAMHERNIYPKKSWIKRAMSVSVGSYKENVIVYNRLVKPNETGQPVTPTIPQARVMHTALGTWDSETTWDSFDLLGFYRVNTLFIRKDGSFRSIRSISPKANYKKLHAAMSRYKEARSK